ncbi:hypothetical protein [Streptomyces sp. NPDC000851]
MFCGIDWATDHHDIALLDEVEGLGDVVDVGGSRDDVQRGALAVADQLVLAARLPPVDRRRTGRGSPLSFARAWEPSTHARVVGGARPEGAMSFGARGRVQAL